MSGVATVLLIGLYLYVLVGIGVAIAFVAFGVTRVFAHPMPVTIPARILLLPGAIVLWPYILVRWLGSGKAL
jgi:hypothetical protein